MAMFKATCLTAALFPLQVLSQLSEMDVAFHNGLGVLNTGPRGGLNRIRSPEFELFKWPWGTIPQRCHTGALEDDLCSPYDMEVFDVWFADCHVPWKLCRCKDSPMSAQNMALRMAQIPVTARQWIRFWSTYNGTVSAGNGGNDITIFGDASDSTSIFFHEVAHSLDSWAMGPDYEGSAFSGISLDAIWVDPLTDMISKLADRGFWKSIVASDMCVPDDYAKTSYNENYAQVYVMVAYNTQVRSIYNYDVECMTNQIESGHDLLEHLSDYYPSAECSRRWSEKDSPRVCMGPRARWSGRCRGVPDPEIEEPDPPVMPPKPTPQPGEDEKVKTVKGMPLGALVDDIAEGGGIAVAVNRADRVKDAQRWRETLERAGRGRK